MIETLRTRSQVERIRPLSAAKYSDSPSPKLNTPRLSRTAVSTSMSMRSYRSTTNICEELRTIKEKFLYLTTMYKEFTIFMPTSLLDKRMVQCFSDLTKAYESFLESSAAQFNIVQAKTSKNDMRRRKNGLLQVRATRLTDTVIEFANSILHVQESGINPHLKILKTCFENLFGTISIVSQSSLATRLSTGRTISAINSLNLSASSLRQTVMDIMNQPYSTRFQDFSEDNMRTVCLNVASKASVVFEKNFPLGISSPPYVTQLRTQMNAAISDIGNIVCAAARFENDVMTMKGAIQGFDGELKSVCSILGIEGGAGVVFDDAVRAAMEGMETSEDELSD